jgi:hypothetical protein
MLEFSNAPNEGSVPDAVGAIAEAPWSSSSNGSSLLNLDCSLDRSEVPPSRSNHNSIVEGAGICTTYSPIWLNINRLSDHAFSGLPSGDLGPNLPPVAALGLPRAFLAILCPGPPAVELPRQSAAPRRPRALQGDYRWLPVVALNARDVGGAVPAAAADHCVSYLRPRLDAGNATLVGQISA